MTTRDTVRLFENARLVLADHVLEGWLAIAEGTITEIGEGRAPERGLDLGGDYLLPGLVELHTDNFETHVKPRPKVRWNLTAAVLAYDAQIATSGITTVFDSLRVGTEENETLGSETDVLADAIEAVRARDALRAEHFTHLRCEVCAPDVVERARSFLAARPAHLISLMDHTPGQRQFRDVEKLLLYYRGKGQSEADLADFMERRRHDHAERAVPHRRALVDIAKGHRVPLASHDDATLDEVAESRADGVSIAEFPVTVEAAAASHDAGIAVMMGAPNVVRGGSHSGNVPAELLAHEGLLDILSSDYVPGSLIQAAFELPRRVPATDLAAAVATVTATPARAAGLADRGRLAVGLRADLVRVRDVDGHPVVRSVWRRGERVA